MTKGIDYIGICVSYICHDEKGRIVLNKRGKNSRDEQGRWDCGGGSLDFGMTVADTLKKEIKEEYGTDVISSEFLGYRDVFRALGSKKTHWLAIDFKVLVDPAKVKNAEPHKFDAVEWFTPHLLLSSLNLTIKNPRDSLKETKGAGFTMNALPTPLHFGFSQMIEKYGNKINDLGSK